MSFFKKKDDFGIPEQSTVIYETGIFPRPQLGYCPNILSLARPNKSGLHERETGYDRGKATGH